MEGGKAASKRWQETMPRATLCFLTFILSGLVTCSAVALAGVQNLGSKHPEPTSVVLTLLDSAKKLQPAKRLAELTKILDLAVLRKDRAGEALALQEIGTLYDDRGDEKPAIQYFLKALPIWREVGDRIGEAGTLHRIGNAYEGSGSRDKAQESYEQSRSIFHELGDRPNEADVLNDLGSLYDDLNHYDRALECLGQALAIERQEKNFDGQGRSSNLSGLVYGELGDHPKEIDCLNQALAAWRTAENKRGQAIALQNLGQTYSAQGQKDKAIAYYQRALQIARESGDRKNEAKTLESIGYLDGELGEMAKALDSYDQARKLWHSLKNLRGELTTLNDIGSAYQWLGQNTLALEFFSRAIAIARQTSSTLEEARTLNLSGLVYSDLKRYSDAISCFRQALSIWKREGHRGGQAVAMQNIGATLIDSQQELAGLDILRSALQINRAIRNRSGQAYTLSSMGTAYVRLGKFSLAMDVLTEALPIERSLGDRTIEEITLQILGSAYARANKTASSILMKKLSVNLIQALRTDIVSLPTRSRESFLTSRAEIYRVLAKGLINLGRLAEAQQVLGLLKGEEFEQFLTRGRRSIAERRVDLTPREAKVAERFEEALSLLKPMVRDEDLLVDSPGMAAADGRRAQLQSQIDVQMRTLRSLLDGLEGEFTDDGIENKIQSTPDLANMLSILRSQSTPTAAVYTLCSANRLNLLAVTPTGIRSFESKLPKDFNAIVFRFANALRNPHIDPHLDAIALYNLIVKPIESALPARGNIIWSLDGVLRYMPLAALNDGRRYLVEKWGMSLFSPIALSGYPNPPNRWTGVGLSVSKHHGVFPQLPGVNLEMAAVFSAGLLNGPWLADEKFTRKSMLEALQQRPSVVHIASHFAFYPGSGLDSFLLLGDGSKFTLGQMKNAGLIFSGVDLLTLSACDTGVGSEAQAGEGGTESMAVVAMKAGASSVLSTLWPVSDASTAALMAEFYQNLRKHPGWTKLRALQVAQIELIHGKISRLFHPSQRQNFADPYYWAPFTLMGNWN